MCALETISSCLDRDDLRGRSVSGICDLSKEEILLILEAANYVKATRSNPQETASKFAGKTLAMIFEKPSLRTRVTFEVAMTEMGGASIFLAPSDIQIGKRESVQDVGANLSRWVHAIMARVFEHSTVLGLAECSTVPVINGLSDLEHPCQALADFQTIADHKCPDPAHPDFRGLKLVFVGDGNNVANSLLLSAAKVGMDMTVACPAGYEPDDQIMGMALKIAKDSGSKLDIQRDPLAAVEDADVVYTDVWTSMGQEDERDIRKADFQGYQVNSELVANAKPDAIVMHCLPAHRGEEITSEVLDGPQSVVLDEAENRLHAQKALLALVINR